jgi:hopanoid biosynthesis associated protein HpnK
MVPKKLRSQLNSCTDGQEQTHEMRSLIVNADDLGWTRGVNRGIAEAFQNGIVTSASLLANGEAFDDGLEIARKLPRLGIGVHLNLSDGKSTAPPTKVKTLLGKAGEFVGGPESLLFRITTKRLDLREVEMEWDAQIGKLQSAGIQLSHVDGHKHVHMLPGLFPIALRLAKKYKIEAIRIAHEESSLRAVMNDNNESARVTIIQGVQARGLKLLARDARKLAEAAGLMTTDFFCGIAQTGILTKKGVLQLMRSLPSGATELMCHPGYADAELQKTATRLQDSRGQELEILTDQAVRKSVTALGIRLINYRELPR